MLNRRVDLTAPKRLFQNFNYVIVKNVDASVENIDEDHADLCELEVSGYGCSSTVRLLELTRVRLVVVATSYLSSFYTFR